MPSGVYKRTKKHLQQMKERGKKIRGKNHPYWKGGPHHCIECSRELKNWYAKRCFECAPKHRPPITDEHRKQLCIARSKRKDLKKYNENNPAWKGDGVGYVSLHRWVVLRLGKPKYCEQCKRTDQKRYEWANISGEYKRDVRDYKRLCKQCHNIYDNVYEKMWETRKNENKKGGRVI